MSEHAKERDEQIEAITERLAAATPGPWRVVERRVTIAILDLRGHYILEQMARGGGDVRDLKDAEFIAHAPRDVEYLLQLVAAQGEALTQAQATIAELQGLAYSRHLRAQVQSLRDALYNVTVDCTCEFRDCEHHHAARELLGVSHNQEPTR